MITALPITALQAEVQDGLFRAIAILSDLGIGLHPWTGPWIVGGCLTRGFVTGAWHPPACDVDVLMRAKTDARDQAWRNSSEWAVVSDSLLVEHGKVKARGLDFDVLVGREDSHLIYWLTGIDLDLSRVATDGKHLIGDSTFFQDIERKTITANSRKADTLARVAKYQSFLPTFSAVLPPEPLPHNDGYSYSGWGY